MDYSLFYQKNTTSRALVKDCLGAELFHTPSGAPQAEGCAISLSGTAGITFLAAAREGRIGVDAELLTRTPPHGFATIFDWTDLEAYCKASGENLFSLAKSRPDLAAIKGVKIERREVEGCAVSVCTLDDFFRSQ